MRVFCHARQLQALLCGEVLEAARALRADPSRFARPLEVVVPSGALRVHYAQKLLAASETSSLLGVRVSTLEGVAHRVLGEGGARTPFHRGLLGVVVARTARATPALATELGALPGGYAAVGGAVDDLLDAGFLPEHREALEDCLLESGSDDPRDQRAAALVGVAEQAWRSLELGLGAHPSTLFTRARERIEEDAATALPVSGLWLVGFADATGVQADFLDSLVRCCGARAFLERPADPAGVEDPGTFFGARLRERLEAAAGLEDLCGAAGDDAPSIELLRAPDREAEVRAVALRLRAHLDAGEPPESIAVVARDLEPYALSLRRWLGRLGVPFSGHAQRAAAGPVTRRLVALCKLLEAGVSAGVEVWLDALGSLPIAGAGSPSAPTLEQRADLLHALHRRGCVRLRDLAQLAARAEAVELPGRDLQGERRQLGAERLSEASRAASALLEQLEAAPAQAPVERHLGWLRGLIAEGLGWGRETPGAVPLAEFLGDPGASRAGAVELSRDEFLGLLLAALDGAGRDALGGAGGGVQVLSVMEARGLVFERIYLLGVNRGAFPRIISEDPLLPDALRLRVRSVLPDLPVKGEGHDEERFLFAQLLGQAPQVVLSWAASSQDAVQLLPSALLEGVRAGGLAHTHADLPPLHALPTSLWAGGLPAAEHALLAGLHGDRAAQAVALEVALESLAHETDAGRVLPAPREQAAARLAVVSEFDTYADDAAELGPYFGFVGLPGPSGAPSVTFVERMARCGWQAFVTRRLRVEPPPDALAALPTRGGNPMLLGRVVHGALEVLVGDALAGLPFDLEAEGVAVPRPGDERVLQVVREVAARELREAAVPIPSYASVLAAVALPQVVEAFRADWSAGDPRVLGVEVDARVEIVDAAGTRRALRFRADRIDRVDTGLRLSDYKTGALRLQQKGADARRNGLLRYTARGELLQGAVYAALGEGAEGRYLYLDPEQPEWGRSLTLVADAEVREALGHALDVILGAHDAGAYAPRLLDFADDQEPRACGQCEVKEACLRGDSTARGRLRRFLETAGTSESGSPQGAAARLLRVGEGAP